MVLVLLFNALIHILKVYCNPTTVGNAGANTCKLKLLVIPEFTAFSELEPPCTMSYETEKLSIPFKYDQPVNKFGAMTDSKFPFVRGVQA